MMKTASLMVAAAACLGLLSAPALAKHKGHARSCYDYAWESQDMKDCLANPDGMKHMPMHKHMKKGMKRDMKGMKGMKEMHDKKS
jgi:hypothetical protein